MIRIYWIAGVFVLATLALFVGVILLLCAGCGRVPKIEQAGTGERVAVSLEHIGRCDSLILRSRTGVMTVLLYWPDHAIVHDTVMVYSADSGMVWYYGKQYKLLPLRHAAGLIR